MFSNDFISINEPSYGSNQKVEQECQHKGHHDHFSEDQNNDGCKKQYDQICKRAGVHIGKIRIFVQI